MAVHKDAVGNTFASSFLFLPSDPRKRVTAWSSLGSSLSSNTKMSHIGAKMQDRPFLGYAGRQSISSLLFFK